MKTMKKLFAILLAVVMVMGLATTAFAADGGYTITINNDGELEQHSYVAYQIFIGDIYKDAEANTESLINLEWGNGVNATSLMNALKADPTIGTKFAGVTIPDALAEDAAQDEQDQYAKNMAYAAEAVAEVLNGLSASELEIASNLIAQNVDPDNEIALVGTIDHYEDANGNTVNVGTEGAIAVYKTPYTATVEEAGYYLVMDAADYKPGEGESYTNYILRVVKDVEVNAKSSTVEVGKTITGVNGVDLTQATDENNAHIGDVLDFEWVGTLPENLSDYDTYYYVFTDTLSKGFTLTDPEGNATNDIQVYIQNGDTKVDVTDYFYIAATAYDATMGTTITVGIQDLLTLDNENTDSSDDTEDFAKVADILATSKIVVTYSARLNVNAVVGVVGNPNKVKLDYSNNPNDDGDPSDAKPETPVAAPKEPNAMGSTPEAQTWTYTTGIILKKVDENGNSLSGAQFEITSTDASINVIVSYTETYTEATADQTATHYALNDGTYTEVDPITENTATEDANGAYVLKPDAQEPSEYDIVAGGKTYAPYDVNNTAHEGLTRYEITLPNSEYYASKKIYVKNTTTTVTGDDESEAQYVLTVGQDGYLRLDGLGEGTYTIKETVAPSGYNLLKETITVAIDWDAPKVLGGECDWTYAWSCTKSDVITKSFTNENEISIINTSGTNLPETGGMGTTLFYVCGTILVLAAGVLLITKKRMGAAE